MSGRGKLGIPDSGIPANEMSEEQVRELGDEIKKPVIFPCIGDTLPNEFTEIGYGEQSEDFDDKDNSYLEEVLIRQVANMDFLDNEYRSHFRHILLKHEGLSYVSTPRYECPS